MHLKSWSGSCTNVNSMKIIRIRMERAMTTTNVVPPDGTEKFIQDTSTLTADSDDPIVTSGLFTPVATVATQDDPDYLAALGVPPARTDLHGSAATAHRAKQIKTAAVALADIHGPLLVMGFSWLDNDYMKGQANGRQTHDH